jgi:hypothetical protein
MKIMKVPIFLNELKKLVLTVLILADCMQLPTIKKNTYQDS